MYDSDQLDSFRYAQMQSSILNKTGASKGSNSGSKFNLVSKFAALEATLAEIESNLRQLSSDTQVTRLSHRSHSDFPSRSTTMWWGEKWISRKQS